MSKVVRSTAEDSAIGALTASLLDRGLDVIVADGYGRPDVLILDPDRGVIAVDVTAGDDPDEGYLKALNRKIADARGEVPALDEFPIHPFVLCCANDSIDERFFLPAGASRELRWLEDISSSPIDSDALSQLAASFSSALSFSMTARGPVVDKHAEERSLRRVRLDHLQAETALRRVKDVLVISGPAGSGKSLVLAARARWLSARHSEWRIQILCYNKALVPYLRSLVQGYENIQVDTFGRFAYGLGHRFSFDDSARAEEEFRQASRRGIDMCVDALLIDESQDFFDGWLKFAAECVFPGRGGIVLAGDEQQALYREASVVRALSDHVIEEVQLPVPYRSTRQILDVVAALDPGFEVSGLDQALPGASVELVWAESVVEQARALVTDLLILNLEGRPWSDMCMLVTQRFMIGPVAGALKRADVPFQVVNTGNALALDLSVDSVKVMTVHGAKGLEFGVVCLVGLEQLKDPEEGDLKPEELASRERTSRLCLVGPTRARDLLFISYTKNSVFLERLRSSDADFRVWTWPDDYAGEG